VSAAERASAREPWRCGAGELAARIAARELSAREVVEAHLARIAEHNPHLNAVVRVLADDARAAAAEADRRVAAGGPLGPLHGVPVTIKENVDLAGTPTTFGVRALAGSVAAVDAPVVERLRAAGAIPIGRTNLPDMGLRVHTDSSLHGLTRNPWSPRHTAGGSSGGEASALAAGLTPLGVGNDIGGSLRNPAHCCGIASIRPTQGLVPHADSLPPEDPVFAGQMMATEGPMARRVADVRLALGVIAGAHPRDPWSVPAPAPVPRPARLRVAVMAEPPGGPVHPAVRAAVTRAADALDRAGCEVREAVPPGFEQALDLWARWLMTDLRVELPMLRSVMGAEAIAFLEHVDRGVPRLDVDGLARALIERRALARRWAAFLDDALLLCPVWTEPAFVHGADVASAEAARATLERIRCVLPANLMGLPAAVVPAAIHEGLPIGVQVVGWRFRDALCLDAAEAIEDALGTFTPIDPVTA
jgi:amidase